MGCREFVDVGGELVNASFSTQQARLRSAVGRAYYGAYHEACDLARAQGETIRGNDHDLVVKAFYKLARDKGDDNFRRVAVALKSLQFSRKIADYLFTAKEDALFATSRFAQECVSDGMSIVVQVDALRVRHSQR